MLHFTTARKRIPAMIALCVATVIFVVPVKAQNGILFVEGGNVGISEANPAHALHVVRSDGTAEIRVEEQNGTVSNRTLFSLFNNGGPEFTLGNTNSSQTWRFHTGAGRFNISLNGSGVDEFKVQPGGDVIIAGSLTTAGGTYPDYVFEEDYDLMPLAQLAAFIERNGHLPSVPTAEETDGGRRINMTELQIKLLEKVEELTLYTLQQEEQIKHQQEVVRALQERVDMLEATTAP